MVRLVDRDEVLAVLRHRGLAEQARRAPGPRPCASAPVAGVAGEIANSIAPSDRQRPFWPAAAQPRLNSALSSHDDRPSDHPRVARARSIRRRTGDSVRAWSASNQMSEAAGHHVRLHAERAANRSWMTSFGRHDQLHRLPTGTCSSLISRCAVEVLELPHPPLRLDDVDVRACSAAWRRANMRRSEYAGAHR